VENRAEKVTRTNSDTEPFFSVDTTGDFGLLRRDGRLYVDKTQVIARLAGPQGDRNVFLDLTPPAVLAGTVVDRATREPLAGVHLIAIGADSEAGDAPGAEETWVAASSTESNTRGEYRLEFVPGESTSLLVPRKGYEPFLLPLDLVPRERRGGYLIALEPE